MRSRSAVARCIALFALFVASLSPAATAGAEITPRIVGGEWADQEYPWMVSIQRPYDEKDHWCGGALVAPQWIATTTHCLWKPLTDRYFARVGSNNRTEGGSYLPIVEFVAHPGFNGSHNDIALLKLAEPVDHPTIPLAEYSPRVGDTIRLLGFGQECPTMDCLGENTVRLKQLDTRVVPDSDCRRAEIAGGHEMCVAATRNSTSCYGDSGGPAVAWRDGTWALVGLDGRGGDPICGVNGVTYTDVAEFRGWLDRSLLSGRAGPALGPVG